MNNSLKKILLPYGKRYAKIERGISELSEEKLLKLRMACKQCTETNIWWASYRAAQVLLPEINFELSKIKKK